MGGMSSFLGQAGLGGAGAAASGLGPEGVAAAAGDSLTDKIGGIEANVTGSAPPPASTKALDLVMALKDKGGGGGGGGMGAGGPAGPQAMPGQANIQGMGQQSPQYTELMDYLGKMGRR